MQGNQKDKVYVSAEASCVEDIFLSRLLNKKIVSRHSSIYGINSEPQFLQIYA